MMHNINKISSLVALICMASTAHAAEQPLQAGRVLKLDLQPGKQRTMLLITHTGEGKFRLFKSEKQGNIIIEAENLNLPSALTRMVDASSSDGPVLQMTPYNSFHSGHPMAKLVLQLRSKADVTSTDLPGKFLVEITKIAGVDVSVPARAKGATGAGWTEKDEIKRRLSAAQKSEEVAKKLIEVLSSPQEEKKYFGTKVTFEAKDAEVPDIFRLVGESSELNIIWDPDVEGQKTSLAVKDLPWDQLLDIVVQQKNYKATVMGNVVRIMSLDTYTKQSEAKKREITLSDELEPVIMAVIPMGFSQAADMKKLIEELIIEKKEPNAPANPTAADGTKISQDFKRGRLQVDDRTNSLIVTNTKDSVERIRRLVKELDVPVPQVLIDSKIVIAQESFSKSVGASWKLQVLNERGNSGPAMGFNDQKLTLNGGEDAEITATNFEISAPAKAGALGWGFGASSQAFVKAALQLAEINGETKTVASPRVIVNNNQKADISDGQTINVPTPGGPNGQITLTPVKAALQLTVKPQVTSHGSIQLKDLTITKDAIVPGTSNVDNKKVVTDVLIDSGATLVLGGIYQFSQSSSRDGIPLLMDLPFIGQLFRVDSNATGKSELMVFITPQIIDPESASQSL